MILIIGGKGQGKLDFAKENFNCEKIFEPKACFEHKNNEYNTINKLNEFIKKEMEKGLDDDEIKKSILAFNEEIIICDEIGSAVVATTKEQRRLVELTGRICCELAKKSDKVIRVFCGLPQYIKG